MVMHAGPGRQLFLDDHGIATMQNLSRSMHRPSKKGAAVKPNLIAGGSPQTRTGPAWDPQEELFKLWDCADTREGTSGYNVSPDGVHWTQPVVEQVEFQGSRQNHYVCYPLENGDTLGPDSVIYDATDANPARRYKALSYYRPQNIMVIATSSDGVHWQRLDTPPIPAYDEFNLSFDAPNHLFIATVKYRDLGSLPYGRCHALSTSHDFENWSKPELIFYADERDQEMAREIIAARLDNPTLQQPLYNDPAEHATDVYNFAIFRYEDLYIGLPAFFYHTGRPPEGRNHDGFHQIQLTCSRDLHHWQRLADRQPFIGPSPLAGGAYDTIQILPPSFPVLRGQELWFYYTGLKYRRAPVNADRDYGAICLATLRRDGFISLDAGTEEGTILTNPLALPTGDLHVNVDASHGQLLAELCDAQGHPITSCEASEVVTGNHTDVIIRWPEGAWARCAGQTLSLRFRLRQAALFAYWFA